MTHVLLIDVPPAVRDRLQQRPASPGMELAFASTEEAAGALDARGDRLDVLVIGPEVPSPIALPQRLYRRHTEFAAVLLAAPEQLEALRASLAIAPYVGADAQCFSAALSAEALCDAVRRAAEGTARRRRYQQTLAALSVKLATSPVLEAQPVGFLDRLFELAPVAIAALDEGQRVLMANQRAFEIFEAGPEQLVGSCFSALFTGPHREAVQQVLRAVPADASGVPLVATLQREAAGGRQVLAVRAAQLAVAGERRVTLLIAEDITEQSRAEEERTALIARLDAAVQVRDEFLTVASHELKTPLTSLRLQLELIARAPGGPLPAAVQGRVDSAVRQVAKLTTLVESLLDVGRMGTGAPLLERQEVDLVPLIRETVERMQALFAQARCEVQLFLPPRAVGQWDPFRLEQVLVNLLSNAAKYGAGRPVEVRLWEEPERVVVSVRDQGIGMDAQLLPRLFRRYVRGVSGKNYGGLGLGLYISREIVTALGGEIRVQSEPGEGSTFELILPR